MTAYVASHTQENNPLVDYAFNTMWGNPELDSQYQLKLARVSPALGYVNNFFYMGKSFTLPSEGVFYHIFSMGGLDLDYWNMGSRGNHWYPFNTWVKASTISHDRGVGLDVYNSKGRIFPRTHTYILNTFEGNTFVAFPVNGNYPIPVSSNMYIRCYTTDINTAIIPSDQQVKWRFGYSGVEFVTGSDLTNLKNHYNAYLAYGIGKVTFFVNGFITDIGKYVGRIGDLLEVYYDPTIKMEVRYQYGSLNNYHSEKDSKRKLLIFPGFTDKPRKYHYFDDCEFFVVNRSTGEGLYYHRNSQDAIRQLTHQDYGLTSDYVSFLISELIGLSKGKATENDFDVVVRYRDTKWQFNLGPNTSRINDLYLLEDPAVILQAMIGPHATVKEWTPSELEKAPCNYVLNSIAPKITTERVRDALGYNGCSTALSDSPLYMPFITPGDPAFEDIFPTPPYTSGLGYRIPASYVESSTAYEYNKDGLYIRKSSIRNSEWFKPSQDTYYVEFVVGQASTWLDYEISRVDVQARPGYGFRVFKAGWIIDENPDPTPDTSLFANEAAITSDGNDIYPTPTELSIGGDFSLANPVGPVTTGKPDGKWVDITDSNEYQVINGVIKWKFDTNNHVGLVIFDTIHLYNEFDLTHVDNSIYFGITHQWEIGGVLATMEPGQLDVWCNGHPLIENVDYKVEYPYVYIISKMWLDQSGTNKFAYRGRGLSAGGLIPSSELGFVMDGVIGYNGRYNLRIDRPTKTIINGRLWITSAIDQAEDIHHGTNTAVLNGFPYEVKHIYCDNKYVEQCDLHWGFNESRELDKKVSDYLAEHVKYKPKVPVKYPYLQEDRYRLFSPFLSQIVNELILGFLPTPAPSDTPIKYPDSVIDNLTRPYQWLLKFDPIKLNMDLRFFSVHPYSNLTRPTVTPNQLTIISRVNDLYLDGKLKIEGFFEVSSNV